MFMTYDSDYVDYVDAIIYYVNNKLDNIKIAFPRYSLE